MARPSPDPLYVLRGSQHPISCVRFINQPSPDNNGPPILLSGCTGGQVRIWDLSLRRCTSCLDGHHGQGILAVDSLDSGQIVSHGRDGCVHRWDLSEGRQDISSSMTAATSNFCGCVLWRKPGHDLIAVPGNQMSEVKVVSLKDHQTIGKLQPPECHKPLGMPMCLKYIDEEQILIGYEDGSVASWDISAGRIVCERKLHTEPVMCLEFSPASQQGVSGSSTDQLIQWNITPQGEMSTQKEVALTNPGLASLTLRGDNKIMALGGWDSRIRAWSWKKLKPLAVLSYHTDTVNSLDFSTWTEASGHLLAAGSKDTHISVWSLYNDHKT